MATLRTAPLPITVPRVYFLSGCHEQWEIALTGQYEVESDLLDGPSAWPQKGE